jgi:hypothetical protein
VLPLLRGRVELAVDSCCKEARDDRTFGRASTALCTTADESWGILHRPIVPRALGVRDYERQSPRITAENVWGKAIHRVVADGISPEQAVDEAIARIKQILSD